MGWEKYLKYLLRPVVYSVLYYPVFGYEINGYWVSDIFAKHNYTA